MIIDNTEEALDRKVADGSITMEDADTVRDFAAFLRDPSSRCIICLGDDQEGATWLEHRKHGRVFLCMDCRDRGELEKARR